MVARVVASEAAQWTSCHSVGSVRGDVSILFGQSEPAIASSAVSATIGGQVRNTATHAGGYESAGEIAFALHGRGDPDSCGFLLLAANATSTVRRATPALTASASETVSRGNGLHDIARLTGG